MNHDRTHALTDGIFAIVMTLLVLELKVPVLDAASNASLGHALKNEGAVFISYLISFLLLFIYWRAHNFIISIMAKNLDMNLINLNMLFLLLVGVVPFTTHLLGEYPNTQLAIIVYTVNIILIGLNLWGMRLYVDHSETIESKERTREQRNSANIRLLTPVLCAAIAIPLSLLSTKLAFAIIMIGISFNLLNNAASIFTRIFRFSRA